MKQKILIACAALCACAILTPSRARAHCFVGARFFPTTLALEDPCVADELSAPTIGARKHAGETESREWEVSGEFTKTLTENFGASVGFAWTHFAIPGGLSASGMHNLETGLHYQILTFPEQEFVVTLGVNAEWRKTGAPEVGAEPFTTFAPSARIGKGFGDLPPSLNWARPFAATAEVGFAIPTWSRTLRRMVDPDSGSWEDSVERHPTRLFYGFSLQYSLPYMRSNVADLDLPDFLTRFIPIVEGAFQSPIANAAASDVKTTGTINPGVIWTAETFQIAFELAIPINRSSGKDVGWLVQTHFYLDDMFPTTIGRPVFEHLADLQR